MNPTWQSDCGRVKLWQADCADVLPELCHAGCVAIMDPPYGTEVGKASSGYGRRQNYNKDDGQGRMILGDKTTETVEMALAIVRTKRCALFASPRPKVWNQVSQLISANGWDQEAWLVWNKTVPGLGFPVQYAHENIAIINRDGRTMENSSVSVLSYYSEARQNATRNHPHQKPKALIAKLVNLYSEKTVIDPFMGSGTTALVCLENGKSFIGIEKDPHWFQVAVERIKEQLSQLPLAREQMLLQ